MKQEGLYDRVSLAVWSDLWQLLSYFFLLPTRSLANALLDGRLLTDLQQITTELDCDGQRIAGAIELLQTYCLRRQDAPLADQSIYSSELNYSNDLLRELRIDYTRMFGHPDCPLVPIYEALILYDAQGQSQKPRLFTNRAALDCERFYRLAGLKLSATAHESPDHLGIQMQFVSYLFGKACAQSAMADPACQDTISLIKDFHHWHLGRWANTFFSSVKLAADTKAYKAIALIGLMLA